MAMNHEPLRYAHDEGHTDVCYSSDGSKFITCGADGDIRIWSSEDSEDPIHNCVGEWALSVRQKGENVYVSTGTNDIQILTFPQGERNGVLDRFVAPINHMAISKNTDHIALAGEDMEVKLLSNTTSDKHLKTFTGLAGPCLSVALSPDAKYLAASSGDGKLRVWNIENENVVHENDYFPKTNSFSNAKTLCRIDFEPSLGKWLAYPEKNKIVLLDTLDWSIKASLNCDTVSCDYTIVQFSPCSKYIMGATVEGDFVIFSISNEKVYKKSKHVNSKSISGFQWNPSSNGQVVYTDVEGQLGFISNCLEKPAEVENADFEDNEVEFGDVQFDDADDEDNENAISLEKLKKDVMGDEESELNFDDDKSRSPTPRARTPQIPLQPNFMPSSTPEHLNPRYLCWNETGVVRSYGNTLEADVNKSIEVEFHDSTFHSSMMLQNFQDYTMGSISRAALVVANSSQINVIPLSASRKEWGLKIDDPVQDIILVSSSETLICFATNNYIIRVCSIFGTQRGVVSIPGPIVSMNSFRNLLIVAYHSGPVRNGDQCINIKLFKFDGFAIESEDISSALGPETSLLWLGFSDVGTPTMMDSLGVISLCIKKVWIPFCDTTRHRKSPSDGFFLTSLTETYQTVCGIKCKGSVYPGFTPRPVCSELPLEPLFAELNTEKSQMEANMFAWTNLQVKDIHKKFTETGLKTFALACRNNLDERAVEFVEMLENPQLLSLATKYAVKLNKKFVADKLLEMTDFLQRGNDATVSVDTINTPDTSQFRISKKLNLSSIKKTQRMKMTAAKELIETPPISSESQLSDLTPTNTTANEDILSTPEVRMAAVEHKNPFLKSLKKPEKVNSNPLSLTDTFAGVEYLDSKENKGEKRKQPDSDNTVKQRGKNPKLNKFVFSK